MKACKQWESTIVEYVDGVCQPEAARKLESHLADCEACVGAVREQLWLKHAVSQMERERAPGYLARRIRDHARVASRRRAFTRLFVRTSFAVSAAVVMVLAVWWGHLRPTSDPVSSAEESTVAQAIVQEYVGAASSDGFSDPSLQMLAREAQMRTLRLEPMSQ